MAAKSDRDSDSILLILFFFQREMERRKRKARWKSRRIRTKRLSHRRQNEEEDKEDEEVDTTAVPWAECVGKKEGFYYSPGRFFHRKTLNLSAQISQRSQKYLPTNEQKETKNTRKRESFLFYAFSYTPLAQQKCLLFLQLHAILHARLRLRYFLNTHILLLRSVVLYRGGPH